MLVNKPEEDGGDMARDILTRRWIKPEYPSLLLVVFSESWEARMEFRSEFLRALD